MRNDGAVLTMSGRAATNPAISGAKGDRISFRVVSTERRFDEGIGAWVDGDEFGVTVACWRQLGSSVLQLLRKGDPVVVVGKISTRRYEKDGAVDYFTEVKADHIGFDLARAAGRVKRDDADVAVAGPTEAPVGSSEPEQPEQSPDESSALPLDPGRPLVKVG